ncbi:hypothetical protein B0A48_08339 [Cryoendolithus antarcticus]|uniref:HECT-type E3 ubiquitin transferase n=1 Tax=Cryoendolithus antarcticus TaxID=1507870 RepID=A0A1V8T565_9PEZI|nr:hypothetical protein B0A48_08339 [Cryoendolithus antarcticus]
MAPSWSSRLLSGSSSQPSARSQSYTSSSKPLPRPPLTTSSSTEPLPRPRTSAGGSPAHTHNRSVSHPLPRLFSRKKSVGNLSGSRDDIDVSLDEGLVPVLVEALPKREVSGRALAGKGDDDGKVQRGCACCGARCRVPPEVGRFRCMGCLTVNEVNLGSNGNEVEDEGRKREVVNLERTRRIMEGCLVGYLEGRCRREVVWSNTSTVDAHRPSKRNSIGRSISLPMTTTVDRIAQPLCTPPAQAEPDASSKQLTDAPVTTSPPDTPGSADFPVMTNAIRDFSDFDLFAYERRETPPPPKAKVPVSGPGPPAPHSLSPRRKPVPGQPTRKPPPPPLASMNKRAPSQNVRATGEINGERSSRRPLSPNAALDNTARERYDRTKLIFRPLEDYMASTFGSFDVLNASFSTIRELPLGRTRSESHISTPPPEPTVDFPSSPIDLLNGLDAKILLLGDIGENGSWWTGRVDRKMGPREIRRKKVGSGANKAVSSKSPNIDWAVLDQWYEVVHSAGEDWRSALPLLGAEYDQRRLDNEQEIQQIETDLAEAREHTIRTLLKITENLLKRPGKAIKQPEDIRWLLILLANPSLHAEQRRLRIKRAASTAAANGTQEFSSAKAAQRRPVILHDPRSPPRDAAATAHTGIIKRILGLLAHAPEPSARYLTTWFSRFDEAAFISNIDLVASFLTHRLTRRSTGKARRTKSMNVNDNGGLIPNLSNGAASTSVQLHSALGLAGSTSTKKRTYGDGDGGETEWAADWQLRAAAKMMSMLFAANDNFQGTRTATSLSGLDPTSTPSQLLVTNYFYTTLLDSASPALISDFKLWESLPSLPAARAKDKFAFCQYPFLLSLGAKIRILEFDARRQMELKAREAYFDSVVRARDGGQHFHLRVRRDCMVDDSLQQIASAVGAGGEDVKKGLRVQFAGEDGVDAGGLRKEWFLLLVREVFDADHGLFLWDDESGCCWFNPGTFETGEEYFLVGALLGLAIYNSTILDCRLPSFLWRKLLASAPSTPGSTATTPPMTYTLTDLAQLHPSLATGLQTLLTFSGDVQETYAWSFAAPISRYGTHTTYPLLPNGDDIPVTNANRTQFVDLYTRHLLDTSVTRQFEPFKRGFWTVCAGNALSLFRPEEVELLVRGSEEAEIDVDTLRAVAVYENFRSPLPSHPLLPTPSETVPLISWFWELFAEAPPSRQRKLLGFITGSDRIPALGAASLVLRIVAGGKGWGKESAERFPSARTCFNQMLLWGYESKAVLAERLWRAVEEGEGFGLK